MPGAAAGTAISSHQLLKQALLAAKEEAAGYEDPEVPLLAVEDESSSGYDDPVVPFLSPHSCHNSHSSSEVNRCAVCSNRRQRGRMAWALLLVWSVPLALAAARWCGGPVDPRSNLQQPDGRPLMVQVLFRHGARTPLSNLYWPNSTWTHCKYNPLSATADSSSSSSSSNAGLTLQLFDPSGAPNPPELSGDDEPVLPGGCRMGHLTDVGFQMALDLGSQLRQRYIEQHKLLPQHRLDLQLLQVESTAVQRTVATLRGVLNGLYPNASGVVPVAVRPYAQEVMTADWSGCPMLANLTTQLTNLQQAQDAQDPALQELQHQVRSGLQLPADAAILWNRLRDELACMEAEGQMPPAAAAQQRLVKRVDYVTTQHRVEVAAPEIGNCLLGRPQQQQCQEVTALTTGRLLHTFIANMATAAAHNNATRAAEDSQEGSADTDSDSDSSSIASEKAVAVTARRLLAAADASAAAVTSSGGGGADVAATATAADSSEDADAADSEQQPQSPRLLLFSAHDTTILPLLSALGQHQTTWPGFTSNLAIELWGHKGKYFVRVLHDGEPLKLPLSEPPQPQGEGSRSGKVALQPKSGPQNLQEGSAGFMGAIRGLVEVVEGWVRGVVSAVDGWLDELGVLIAQAVGGRGTAVSAGRLQSNGQGAYNSVAYVVTLDEFQQRVVQDYVMKQEQYAAACGGGGNAAGVQTLDDTQAKRRWHAQFY